MGMYESLAAFCCYSCCRVQSDPSVGQRAVRPKRESNMVNRALWDTLDLDAEDGNGRLQSRSRSRSRSCASRMARGFSSVLFVALAVGLGGMQGRGRVLWWNAAWWLRPVSGFSYVTDWPRVNVDLQVTIPANWVRLIDGDVARPHEATLVYNVARAQNRREDEVSRMAPSTFV
ncbi:hypothetical protein F4802DRAFT_55651 [Xylaria palmicola]|nr:hypothetical protein F4802DRAFT_55651 [Xylaria palmicola]